MRKRPTYEDYFSGRVKSFEEEVDLLPDAIAQELRSKCKASREFQRLLRRIDKICKNYHRKATEEARNVFAYFNLERDLGFKFLHQGRNAKFSDKEIDKFISFLEVAQNFPSDLKESLLQKLKVIQQHRSKFRKIKNPKKALGALPESDSIKSKWMTELIDSLAACINPFYRNDGNTFDVPVLKIKSAQVIAEIVNNLIPSAKFTAKNIQSRIKKSSK